MQINLDEVKNELCRRHLIDLAKVLMPSIVFEPFHQVYYTILEKFAKGEIKRLIISMPPQHGKSQGSTRFIPAFIAGRDPSKDIAIASYNDTLAKKFGRHIKQYMRSPEYVEVFGNVIPESRQSDLTNTANEVDLVEGGTLKFVGRGGALTGNPVDIMIMDDLYKDFAEGNSPIIREAVWDWYTSVVKTRLHNDSQELIVFTRWHEDDLIGRLEENDNVISVNSWDQIENVDPHDWIKINFEAIKESAPNEIDPREVGQSLWENRHNISGLYEKRKLDKLKFECLYQGDPQTNEGLLYNEFKVYDSIPNGVKRSYTDTADEGDDYLAHIEYVLFNRCAYVTNVIYTQKKMEETEVLVSNSLKTNGVVECLVESNNGGKGFARKITELSRKHVKWFHQSLNKESRILTNASTVNQNIIFPVGWELKWPLFYKHVTTYKRTFKANKHDDAIDALTGIIEKSNSMRITTKSYGH